MTPDINIRVYLSEKLWMEFNLPSCKNNLKGMDNDECDTHTAMRFMLESVVEETWYLFGLQKEAK